MLKEFLISKGLDVALRATVKSKKEIYFECDHQLNGKKIDLVKEYQYSSGITNISQIPFENTLSVYDYTYINPSTIKIKGVHVAQKTITDNLINSAKNIKNAFNIISENFVGGIGANYIDNKVQNNAEKMHELIKDAKAKRIQIKVHTYPSAKEKLTRNDLDTHYIITKYTAQSPIKLGLGVEFELVMTQALSVEEINKWDVLGQYKSIKKMSFAGFEDIFE